MEPRQLNFKDPRLFGSLCLLSLALGVLVTTGIVWAATPTAELPSDGHYAINSVVNYEASLWGPATYKVVYLSGDRVVQSVTLLKKPEIGRSPDIYSWLEIRGGRVILSLNPDISLTPFPSVLSNLGGLCVTGIVAIVFYFIAYCLLSAYNDEQNEKRAQAAAPY